MFLDVFFCSKEIQLEEFSDEFAELPRHLRGNNNKITRLDSRDFYWEFKKVPNLFYLRNSHFRLRKFRKYSTFVVFDDSNVTHFTSCTNITVFISNKNKSNIKVRAIIKTYKI